MFNLRQHSETTTCKVDVNVKNGSCLISIFSFFDMVPPWHICHEKYRVSTTNVPVFIEIRSGDEIRYNFFDKPNGLQTVKFPIWRKYEDWVRLANLVHIAQNQSRSRPYLPPIKGYVH